MFAPAAISLGSSYRAPSSVWRSCCSVIVLAVVVPDL